MLKTLIALWLMACALGAIITLALGHRTIGLTLIGVAIATIVADNTVRALIAKE